MKSTALSTGLAAVALTILQVTPLAAADATYTITVETDSRDDAGTDANVYITLGSGPAPANAAAIGCGVSSGAPPAFPERQLVPKPGQNPFERGQTDTFVIQALDLSDVPWICLRHDNTREKPGWFVNTVTIQKEGAPQVWRFLLFRWLAVDEDDHSLAVIVRQVPESRTVNGRAHTCDDFSINLSIFFFDKKQDIPDPGWVLVKNSDPIQLVGRSVSIPKFRSVSGSVTRSEVTYTDYPDVHDSHDMNIDVFLDPLSADSLPILSDLGKQSNRDGIPDTLEMEWETGILTNEFQGDGSARFFPKWAWPIEGDRVWANGYWIFDCGHPEGGRTHTEIHPIRAIASMRQQAAIPPDSTVPIPVTATDLYVHGRAGVATDILECGQGVILDKRSCPTRSGTVPRGCDIKSGNDPVCHDPVADHLGIPINEDFEFDVCAPLPRTSLPDTVLKTWVLPGPGNTVTDPTRDPVLQIVPVGDPSVDACAGPGFGPQKVHVRIPLANVEAPPNAPPSSPVIPDDVYSRKIYAGWIETPQALRHFQVRLNSMLLIDDLDEDGPFGLFQNDCECTFFWMNLDRAPNQWIRLSDFAQGNMNDFGDGERMRFTDGAVFDFLVPDGQPVTIRAHGYDGGVTEQGQTCNFLGCVPDPAQDCLDKHFGHHDFTEHVDFDLNPFSFKFPNPCFADLAVKSSNPENDRFDDLQAILDPSNSYRVGQQTLCSGNVGKQQDPCSVPHQYELAVNVEEIAVPADLSVTMSAKIRANSRAPFNDIAPVGSTLLYTIDVINNGPGLATGITVVDTLPKGVTFDSTNTGECKESDNVVTCRLVSPLGSGERVEISIFTRKLRAAAAGNIVTNTVAVSSSNSDPNSANNTAINNITIAPLGDLNADLSVDCADLAIVLAALGSKAGFFDITDINQDGIVDVRDLALVSRAMPAGAQCGDLSISLTDLSDPTPPGMSQGYSLKLVNHGPGFTGGITVTVTLPAGVVYVGASISGTCNPSGSIVTCRVGDAAFGLKAFEEFQFGITVTIAPDVKGIITTKATVTTLTPDPNTANNTATEDTMVTPPPMPTDMSISISDSPDPVLAGSELTYLLDIINNGPNLAEKITIIDTLPEGVTFLRAPAGGCEASGVTVTCSLGSLPLKPGERWQFGFVVAVSPTARGTITNSATLTTLAPDLNPADNTDTEETVVVTP